MEITFVGTGSGKVSLNRFFSAFIIKAESRNVLIDCGDGISKALIHSQIDCNSISSILISHFHADHYTGLASLITQMKIAKRTKLLEIYLPKGYLNYILTFLHGSFIFEETLKFKILFIEYEENKKYLLDKNFSFTARKNTHVKKKKEVRSKKILWKSFSFLFSCNAKILFYTSDIGSPKDLHLFEEYKIDCLITETSHIEFNDIKNELKKLNPSKTLLTHINMEDEEKLALAVKVFKKKEKMKIFIASDKKKFFVK